MKYRSRISILFVIFILGIFSIPLFDGIVETAKIITLSIFFVFVLLTLVTINYTISDECLIIRIFGFKKASIDIARITTINRSYNPISSPAASLKRLEVKFHNKGRIETALISPVCEVDFLEKLKKINPNIDIKVVPPQNILHFLDWDI